MKYKLEATIATGSYSNIRPVFEIEEGDEMNKAVDELKALWKRFGETPLKERVAGGIKIESFTGETLLWNQDTHTYTDIRGNVLLSGSAYADQHSPQFDMEMILPKTAKAWGVGEEELRALWKMNSDVSLHWGSAIHNALEIAHKYKELGTTVQAKKELDQSYTMPKQPYLNKIVTGFVEKFGLDALPEVVVSDVKNKMAGTIDRLQITGGRSCRIGDYKTNAEMDSKKTLKYQKQLSFYAHILINHGWSVEGLDLFHFDDETGWAVDTLEVLDLE